MVFNTLKDIQQTLKIKHSIEPSLSTIHRVLKQCKVSRRRFNMCSVNPKMPCDMNTLFLNFKTTLEQFKDHQIVCLDETAFCNIGNASYSYFPKGKQPIQHFVPKRSKFSALMAIHPTGVISSCLQPSAFNKSSFIEALKGFIPKLPPQTKAVLMDNVSFHKSAEVVKLFESHKIIPLYIPPRCNPIEEVFSVLKRSFRNLSYDQDFKERVMTSIQYLNLYKDLSPYYKHTREYVQMVCRQTYES